MDRYGKINLARKNLPWEQGLYGTTLPYLTDPAGWKFGSKNQNFACLDPHIAF